MSQTLERLDSWGGAVNESMVRQDSVGGSAKWAGWVSESQSAEDLDTREETTVVQTEFPSDSP